MLVRASRLFLSLYAPWAVYSVKMVGLRGIEPRRACSHLLPKQDRCQITELQPELKMVGAEGFEPPGRFRTRFQNETATKLRTYAPTENFWFIHKSESQSRGCAIHYCPSIPGTGGSRTHSASWWTVNQPTAPYSSCGDEPPTV